ncbi:MAG: hypothetical protein IPG88_14140 [Gemmatimonadetes bacterium]|nr:hypothetical protein [Gemmatimonadota bacterium]
MPIALRRVSPSRDLIFTSVSQVLEIQECELIPRIQRANVGSGLFQLLVVVEVELERGFEQVGPLVEAREVQVVAVLLERPYERGERQPGWLRRRHREVQMADFIGALELALGDQDHRHHGEGDEGDPDLVGAEAEPQRDDQEEVGQLLGLLDGGAEAHDRERPDEA